MFVIRERLYAHPVDLRPSAAKQMRTALPWALMQRVMIIPYRSFGTCFFHFQGSRFRIIDPWRLDQ